MESLAICLSEMWSRPFPAVDFDVDAVSAAISLSESASDVGSQLLIPVSTVSEPSSFHTFPLSFVSSAKHARHFVQYEGFFLLKRDNFSDMLDVAAAAVGAKCFLTP